MSGIQVRISVQSLSLEFEEVSPEQKIYSIQNLSFSKVLPLATKSSSLLHIFFPRITKHGLGLAVSQKLSMRSSSYGNFIFLKCPDVLPIQITYLSFIIKVLLLGNVYISPNHELEYQLLERTFINYLLWFDLHNLPLKIDLHVSRLQMNGY